MKNKTISLVIFLLMSLALSACGAEAAPTAAASEEISVNAIYTSAAMTLVAQAPKATNTSFPKSLPTVAPITTLVNQPTVTAAFVSLISASSNSTSCDSATYLSDVTIPDGTVLTPGETFTKTWSLQNTGTCAWSTSYSIVFYSGSAMSGVTTALSEAVSSGGSASVSVELTAPTTAGTYTGYWRLQNESGASFGETVYVQIVVSGNTSTPSVTPTESDEESEATSTPTATTAPTSTTAPTDTPEPTETPSP